MGSNDKLQDELFYAFNLDDLVPQDHLLRDIDRLEWPLLSADSIGERNT
jgi:hypothetical protein